MRSPPGPPSSAAGRRRGRRRSRARPARSSRRPASSAPAASAPLPRPLPARPGWTRRALRLDSAGPAPGVAAPPAGWFRSGPDRSPASPACATPAASPVAAAAAGRPQARASARPPRPLARPWIAGPLRADRAACCISPAAFPAWAAAELSSDGLVSAAASFASRCTAEASESVRAASCCSAIEARLLSAEATCSFHCRCSPQDP